MLLFESVFINCENEIQKVDYFIKVSTGSLRTFGGSTNYFLMNCYITYKI